MRIEREIIYYNLKYNKGNPTIFFGIFFPANFMGGVFSRQIAVVKSKKTNNYAVINCNKYRKIPSIKTIIKQLIEKPPLSVKLVNEIPIIENCYKKTLEIKTEELYEKLYEAVKDYLKTYPLPDTEEFKNLTW